jgi:hypothetical protein
VTSISVLTELQCDCRDRPFVDHVLTYDASKGGTPHYSETFTCGRCGLQWHNEGAAVPADVRDRFERAYGRWRVQLTSPGDPPPEVARFLVEHAMDQLLKPEAEHLLDEIRRLGGEAEIVAEPPPTA